DDGRSTRRRPLRLNQFYTIRDTESQRRGLASHRPDSVTAGLLYRRGRQGLLHATRIAGADAEEVIAPRSAPPMSVARFSTWLRPAGRAPRSPRNSRPPAH